MYSGPETPILERALRMPECEIIYIVLKAFDKSKKTAATFTFVSRSLSSGSRNDGLLNGAEWSKAKLRAG